MEDFQNIKKQLIQKLEEKNITYRDWGDGLALRFSDGCDDFFFTEKTGELLDDFIRQFEQVNICRSRIMNAVRHAAYQRNLYLCLNRSGNWTVGAADGSEWSVNVGNELTELIVSAGETAAFRATLKELSSWETGIGCLGAIISGGILLYKRNYVKGLLKIVVGCISSVAGGLAKSVTSSISFRSSDSSLKHYLDRHASPPAKENSWEEFERLEDEREYEELFPETEGHDDGGSSGEKLLDRFTMLHGKGPELVVLDEQLITDLDIETNRIIDRFRAALPDNSVAMDKIKAPWFNGGVDVWADRDFLIDIIEKQALQGRENNDFWSEINNLEKLLVLKCDKYRDRTRQLLDEWWEGGGHDMQDYPELLNAFPDHPATGGMLEPDEMSLDHSMAARRRYEVDLYRELTELMQTDELARAAELDDVLEIMNCISSVWIKRIMTEEQIEYIYKSCLNAARGGRTEDLQFVHEHIFRLACKMEWPDVAEILRKRADYSALLFGFSVSAGDMMEWTDKVKAKFAHKDDDLVESDSEIEEPEIFDFYYFADSLLRWSLMMPDEYTLRLAATGIQLLDKGKGDKDDYLACSIAWQRCRKA